MDVRAGNRGSARGALAWLAAGALALGVGVDSGDASALAADDHPTAGATMSIADVRALVTDMEQAYATVYDYTAIFYKRERVGGRMLPRETIALKFRKPFSVYLKWVGDRHEGQESIYVQGWNNGKLRAHPGSFPDVTVNLSPRSRLAMRGNRHPITDAGIGKTIDLIARDIRRGAARPGDDVSFVDHGRSRVYGRPAHCVEAVLPAVEHSGYYAHRAHVCVDRETTLPLRVQIYDHRDRLIEDYGYKNLRVNQGLGPADFDPENPAYDF